MAQSSFLNYFRIVRYSVSIAGQADEDGETALAMTVGGHNVRLRFPEISGHSLPCGPPAAQGTIWDYNGTAPEDEGAF
jgi:hypothetical protein